MARDNIIDFELPINSTINGNSVFHEKNHDDRDYPHQQYIEKIPKHTFIATESDSTSHINKYKKIASIKYLQNVNVEMRHTIKFYELNYGGEHTLYVNMTNSASALNHSGKSNLVFYGVESNITDDTGTTRILDIYAKPTQDWTYFFFRLEFARASNYFEAYPDSYAYKAIALFNNEPYLDSITATINETIKERRTSGTTPSTSISANTNNKFYVPIPGVTTNCVVNVSPNVNLDASFIYSISLKTDQVVITVRNCSKSALTLPDITWNIEFKNLV